MTYKLKFSFIQIFRSHHFSPARVSLWTVILVSFSLTFSDCDLERRKSDSELGLNAQQAAGRRIYDDRCDRCHAPYSNRGRKGPSLKGVFRKAYLAESGLPANDDRVGDIIRDGRAKMPGFGQVLDRRQVEDLLSYLHTL
ncbi:MAG: hypothetical protein NVS1B11_20350 [Terriglobales bacterium]